MTILYLIGPFNLWIRVNDSDTNVELEEERLSVFSERDRRLIATVFAGV